MAELEEDRESIYVSKMISFNWLVGWGLFILFATVPIFTMAAIYFSLSFLLLWMVLFLGSIAFGIIYQRRIEKLRYHFWLDLNRTDLKRSIQWLGYSVLSSLVVLSILHLFYTKLLFDIRFGVDIFNELDVFLPPIVLGVESAIMLPAMYLIFRHLDRKYANSQKWTKQFRISKDDLDRILEDSLRALNLQFSEIAEGSKLTGVTPVLEIASHNISIQTSESGLNSSSITLIAKSPLYISDALRIRKEVDTNIVVD